jgi:hypothetical protein
VFGDAFWVPKKGNTRQEYEDAFAPRHLPANKDKAAFRVAVADGATETSFSGLWARLLVASYATGQLAPECFGSSLRKLQERWRLQVDRKNLPWYAEEKARRGAAAALLGLHILEGNGRSDEGSWAAIAVGDCCLIHVRGGNVIERFPLQSAADFTNTPFLLPSRGFGGAGWEDHIKEISGTWFSDDTFYLMSDALAAWFMQTEEDGGAPYEVLRDLGTADCDPFPNWIENLRAERSIHNDDVTLLRIAVF